MKISKLKFYRLKEKMSQEEAAQKIGISRGYLSQLENNRAALSSELLLRIARIYNVHAKELT
jgi:transcriptional regulator with XRE-family HTH domain